MTDSISQGIMPISLPGDKWDKKKFFRFTGQGRKIDISWSLYNDNADKSDNAAAPGNQTAPDPPFTAGVKTLAEQMRYLRDYVFDEGEDVDFELYHTTYFPNGIDVVPTDITFTPAGDMPSEILATITLECASNMI